MARNTAAFFRFMNQTNESVANSSVLLSDIESKKVHGDPVRIQRDAERRAKAGGPLRAIAHPRSRPHRARFVLGARAFRGPKLD